MGDKALLTFIGIISLSLFGSMLILRNTATEDNYSTLKYKQQQMEVRMNEIYSLVTDYMETRQLQESRENQYTDAELIKKNEQLLAIDNEFRKLHLLFDYKETDA